MPSPPHPRLRNRHSLPRAVSNGGPPSDYAARELWTAIPCDSLECRRVIPSHALTQRTVKRTRRWLTCSANSRNRRRRHLLSSRLLGCLQRSRGLFRFRAQPNCIDLKKTSEPRTSNLQLKISVPSKAPPQTSRSKG